MQLNTGIYSHWLNHNIVMVSSEMTEIDDEVSKRLARRDWKISHVEKDFNKAFEILRKGEASVLVIDDTVESPASLVLRNQLNDPIALLTPTIVISPDHQKDKNVLKEVGIPEIIDYPMNPTSFTESLEFLLRRWSSDSFKKVLAARTLLVHGKKKLGLQALSQLIQNKELMPLVTPPLAQSIRNQSDSKVIEKLLLNGIKEFPRNIGIILSTIDFYINMAMPETAMKIVEAAKKNLGNPILMIPEQVQALLMLNDIKACIPLLETMVEANYMPERAKDFLSRCYYAEGQVGGFINAIGHKRAKYNEFHDVWHKKSGESA